MKIADFLEKHLLVKSKSNAQEIEGSMAVAQRFLEKAEGNLKIGYFDVAFSLAYQSMFHAARALLFKKDFKERSHAALIATLKELYGKEHALLEILETMDSYRMTRHAVQYSGIGCAKEDAEDAIKQAGKLIQEADKTLKK